MQEHSEMNGGYLYINTVNSHNSGVYISGPGKARKKKKEKGSSFERPTAGLWNMGHHSQRSDCGFVSYRIHNKGMPQSKRSQSGCSYINFMKREDLSR